MIAIKIVTRSMSVSFVVSSLDEQNPSWPSGSVEQINPEQQSESDLQAKP